MRPLLKFVAFVLLTGILFYVSCKKEYSCENCNQKNKPPIANAGRDTIIVLPVDSVKLDGSLSRDPDGTITTFLWTKISGPSSFNINNATVVKTVAKNLIVGVYQFELKVTDDGGLSAKDTMSVIVDSVVSTNHPPVANAGIDLSSGYCVPGGWIGRNDSIFLDGNGSSDPDNNIVSYQWTRITGPPLPALSPAGVPGHATQIAVINLQPGIVQFELKVTDAGGLSSKDTAQVTVWENHSPIASIAPVPAITLPTNTVNLNGSGSTDPENNIRSYEWTKISGPASFNIMNPTAVQTQVTNLVQGSYQFQLKVTDYCGVSSTDLIQVIVNPAVPLPTANAGPDIIITLPLDSVYLGGSTSSFPVTFQWIKISGPPGITITNSNIYSLTSLVKGLIPGLYSFRLEVSDGIGISDDTMNVLVIDDPQDLNTITFKNLKWRLVDEYGTGTIDLNIETPNQPNLFIAWDQTRPIEVYLQTDSISQFFIVPSVQSGFLYAYDAARPIIWIARIPRDDTWAGKESSIKIKLL